MDIVIPWLLAWAYPLIGAAVTMYAARSHFRHSKDTNPLAWESALTGLGLGAVWPVGLLYVVTVNSLHKEADRKKAESRQEMTLETAQRVIARHEIQLALDRKARNDRLKRDWEKLAREAMVGRRHTK